MARNLLDRCLVAVDRQRIDRVRSGLSPPSDPQTTMPRPKTEAFRFIELAPFKPTQPRRLEVLSELVAETATWFFGDPDFVDGRTVRPELDAPSSDDLLEAVNTGTDMLSSVRSGPNAVGGGAAVVDLFCQRYVDDEPDYIFNLRSGRSIGQRQLLCALALRKLEFAARAIRASNASLTATCMADVLELICEVRRALDREAGADVASRAARKRHEKNYRIRRMAEALFDATTGPSVLARATTLYPKVEAFSKELKAPLTPTRGPKTVYDWLRPYAKRSTSGGRRI